MAASPLQAAGGVPSCRNALHRTLSPENSDFVSSSSSLPAILGGLGQCEHGEVSWDRNGNGARDLHLQRGQQELLWRQYFLDPSVWLDHRKNKKSVRSPDFRHRESMAALWLNSLWKPAWVDDQLAAADLHRGPPGIGPRRAGGCRVGVSAGSVSKLCEMGQLSEAVDALGVLVQTNSRVPKSLLLQEVKDVFTRVPKPDVFSWSAVIAAHAQHGDPELAVQLYQKMRSSGVKPDCHLFVAALQACGTAADVASGRIRQAWSWWRSPCSV